MRLALLAMLFGAAGFAQEANSGLDLAATVTAGTYYSHQAVEGPVGGGFRAVFYPTWKMNSHWSFSGAIQVRSSPYFAEDFSRPGRSVIASPLAAHLDYSLVGKNRSIVVRAGILQSAFGSFLLRYDDAVNPLTQSPAAYGYAYKAITNLGLAGVQVDATLGPADFRAQFVNSSPANRRSVFDSEQYGNWAGGVGYTIRQGFRAGVSAYRGPYLDRHYPFYFPGEARPRDLPGSAYGIDVQWGHGAWNVYGELQKFQMIYRAIPDFNQHTGYVEVRRVLSPRWYAATRVEYLRMAPYPGYQAYELAAGLRLNTRQLVKFGYQIQQGPAIRGSLANVAAIQFVTNLRLLSVARD